MRVDLHNHTPLCNHATGTPREYVLKAIEQKIDIFGFSDHNPMDFDKKYRMSFKDMAKYEKEILKLKDEFKDQIDIRLAYEVDYLPKHMDSRVLDAKVDYLVGSVHFLNEWGFDNPEFIGRWKGADVDYLYEQYFEAIKDMANSGKFQIAGHLDLIKVFNYKPKKDIKLVAKEALKAIKKANMAIEINARGYTKPVNEPYPSVELLQLSKELDIPITFASDAHKVEDIGFKYHKLKELARDIGYNSCVSFINKDMLLHKF